MISIIIPVYNAGKYLERCINSVCNQTYRDIEIILINDGSTDKSSTICDYYASLDNRIKVIHKINEGVAAARNDGLKIANGDYIGFVDSDDYIGEKMYKELYKSAQTYNADIVQSGYEKISPAGISILSSHYKDKVVIGNKNCFKEYCEGENIVNYCWCRIYKREILKDIYFGKFHYSEDAYFIIQVFLRCEILVIRSGLYYKYVQTTDSACKQPFNLFYEDTVTVGQLMYNMCKGVYPNYSCYFARYIAINSYNCYRGFDMSDFKNKEDMKEKYWNYFIQFFKESKILLPITKRDSLLMLFRICPKLTISLVNRRREFTTPNN